MPLCSFSNCFLGMDKVVCVAWPAPSSGFVKGTPNEASAGKIFGSIETRVLKVVSTHCFQVKAGGK